MRRPAGVFLPRPGLAPGRALAVALGLMLLAAAPAGASPASSPAGSPSAAPASECPPGPEVVASREPIEVLAGQATVAFTVEAGCTVAELSLASYRSSQVPVKGAALLDLATGRFPPGKVHRLTVAVKDDCTFRVWFVADGPGKLLHGQAPDGERLIEAVAQSPDPCALGAAPVTVDPSRAPDQVPASPTASTSGLASRSSAPSTTRPPHVRGRQRPQGPSSGSPGAARRGPSAAERDTRTLSGASGSLETVQRAGAGDEPPAAGSSLSDPLSGAERMAAASDTRDATVKPDQQSPLAGWRGFALLLAISALITGAMLLRTTEAKDQEHG